jgi:quercetin dioxygenase-like cupin family protein
MNLRVIALAASAAAASLLPLAVMPADAAGSMYMNPEQVKWGDAPPVLPKGAKIAVLEGDPGKAGPFVMRLKVPANYRIAPHWHSKDENLTVVSGTFYLGEGDKPDAKAAHAIKAGGYHHLPANTHHYAFAKGGEAVVQVHGDGPFDITYVNPADDPSKAAAKK